MSNVIRSDPELWEQSKSEAIDALGGRHSARAMQLAVKKYKEKGGYYINPNGTKSTLKDKNNSLVKWTNEKWTTKSGRPSLETGERYLPSNVIDNLSDDEYEETSNKKRIDLLQGKQWSSQPDDIKKKTSFLKSSTYK